MKVFNNLWRCNIFWLMKFRSLNSLTNVSAKRHPKNGKFTIVNEKSSLLSCICHDVVVYVIHFAPLYKCISQNVLVSLCSIIRWDMSWGSCALESLCYCIRWDMSWFPVYLSHYDDVPVYLSHYVIVSDEIHHDVPVCLSHYVIV